MKALAILAHKAFANLRPSGVKVHAGAVLLEPGLTEADFREMAAAGVTLVGEIGISGVKDAAVAAEMTRWAQSCGMRVMVHTGGASIPGSGIVGADFVVQVQPGRRRTRERRPDGAPARSGRNGSSTRRRRGSRSSTTAT